MPNTSILLQQSASRRKKHWANKTFESELIVSSNYNIPATQDGPTIIKYLKGLTINSGFTLTTSVRCKGLVLFIDGNCTINGTLSMTARGANVVGDDLAIDYKNAEFLVNPSNLANYTYTIPKTGASGYTVTVYPHSGFLSGSTGNNGQTGGGGAGSYKGGSGAAGTSYSGGSGGGGNHNPPNAACNASANGGQGGYGYGNSAYGGNYGGSGAGNPAGTYYYGIPGVDGTGGLLVLVVNGNLNIGPTGKIVNNGSNGGGGGSNPVGGGGSGGGNITVLYIGNYSNSGTIQANGGTGGSPTQWTGGAGGAGSITVSKIGL